MKLLRSIKKRDAKGRKEWSCSRKWFHKYQEVHKNSRHDWPHTKSSSESSGDYDPITEPKKIEEMSVAGATMNKIDDSTLISVTLWKGQA